MEMQDSYLLVRRDPPESELIEHKLVLPNEIRFELPFTCEVLAVGPGKLLEYGEREVMDVKVGDRVIICHGQGVPAFNELEFFAHIEMVEAGVTNE
jgi:co-chaperonin GroES (HSP10)